MPVQQPNEDSHNQFSYKMKYTINFHAISNHNGKLINIKIKWPGSVDDATVFARYKKATLKKNNLFYEVLLPGEEWVPQVILANPSYPLLPYIVKECDTCHYNKTVCTQPD